MSREWAVFAAVAVMLLAGGGLAIALISGGDDPPLRMRVESVTGPMGQPELVVTVGDDANVPAVTGGARIVGLRCRDRAGETVMGGRHQWPFERDGVEGEAHIHQLATPQQMARIERCTLTGTKPRLEARLK